MLETSEQHLIKVRGWWGQAGDTQKLKGGYSDLRTVPAKLYVYVLLGKKNTKRALFFLNF